MGLRSWLFKRELKRWDTPEEVGKRLSETGGLMGAKGKQWMVHVGLMALAAGLASIGHATAEGDAISRADLVVAVQTAIAYLAGAVLKAPQDARDPLAQTRASDTSLAS